jgi:hypothetical protein
LFARSNKNPLARPGRAQSTLFFDQTISLPRSPHLCCRVALGSAITGSPELYEGLRFIGVANAGHAQLGYAFVVGARRTFVVHFGRFES